MVIYYTIFLEFYTFISSNALKKFVSFTMSWTYIDDTEKAHYTSRVFCLKAECLHRWQFYCILTEFISWELSEEKITMFTICHPNLILKIQALKQFKLSYSKILVLWILKIERCTTESIFLRVTFSSYSEIANEKICKN